MNILKWFEYLPEDLWNVMVCYAHEQDLENKECGSLSEAIWSLNWDMADQAKDIDDDAVVFIDRLSSHSLWNKYRLISEEDWELLEEAKKEKDKEREFVSRFQPVKTPEVLDWPNFVNKNIDVINRDMGKPIKSKK